MPESEQSDVKPPPISRRDLLTFWGKPPSLREQNKQEAPPLSGGGKNREGMPSLTRRQFLKFVGAVALSLGAKHHLDIKPLEAKSSNQPKSQERGILPQTNMQFTEQQYQEPVNPPPSPPSEYEPTLVDTEMETALLVVAQNVLESCLKALKIPLGTAMDPKSIKKLVEMPFYKLILLGGVGIPLLEEAIFRGLPNLAVKGRPKENVWEVGIPVSALFALLHNVTGDEAKKIAFLTDRIPLSQFVFGLFFWRLMRQRGFPHAVAAHSTVNSVALSVGKLLYEAIPEKFDDK